MEDLFTFIQLDEVEDEAFAPTSFSFAIGIHLGRL